MRQSTRLSYLQEEGIDMDLPLTFRPDETLSELNRSVHDIDISNVLLDVEEALETANLALVGMPISTDETSLHMEIKEVGPDTVESSLVSTSLQPLTTTGHEFKEFDISSVLIEAEDALEIARRASKCTVSPAVEPTSVRINPFAHSRFRKLLVDKHKSSAFSSAIKAFGVNRSLLSASTPPFIRRVQMHALAVQRRFNKDISSHIKFGLTQKAPKPSISLEDVALVGWKLLKSTSHELKPAMEWIEQLQDDLELCFAAKETPKKIIPYYATEVKPTQENPPPKKWMVPFNHFLSSMRQRGSKRGPPTTGIRRNSGSGNQSKVAMPPEWIMTLLVSFFA